MLFPDGVKPQEIVHGVVQVLGARKVQVQIDKRTAVARCDKELLNTLSVGSTVIVAFLGSDQTVGYVMSVATDPFDQNDQGVFSI